MSSQSLIDVIYEPTYNTSSDKVVVDLIVTGTQSLDWNHFLYYVSLIKSATVHATLVDNIGLFPFFLVLVLDGSLILCSLQSLYWEQGPLCNDLLFYILGLNIQALHVGD